MRGRIKNLIPQPSSTPSVHLIKLFLPIFILRFGFYRCFFGQLPVFRVLPVERKSSHIDVALRQSIIYDLQKSLGRYLVSLRRSYKISVFSSEKKPVIVFSAYSSDEILNPVPNSRSIKSGSFFSSLFS